MIGDMIGKPGRVAVEQILPELRDARQIDFVTANGENVAGGMGLTRVIIELLFSPDQDAFLMANSWGSSWGIDGCAFLPFDALDRLMSQGGVVCSAIED